MFLENFRPGALEAKGLGYDGALEGESAAHLLLAEGLPPGPYEKRTALDEVVQMMSGLAYMTGPAAGRCAPARP